MRKFGLLSTVALLFATVTTGPALAGEYVLFYHNDTLGSPVAVTDINGNVVWRADYEPFGNPATLTETLPNTHQFLGKEVDAETSLHSLGARFYDGSLGRFLSVDPALYGTEGFLPQDPAPSGGMPKFALHNPQYLNGYAYSLNNPYSYVDPTGKLSVSTTFLLLAGAAYGVYNAYQTLHDPNASRLERNLAVGGAILGMTGPAGNVVSKGIQVVEKDLVHLLIRHGPASTVVGTSKFAKGVDVMELIRKAEAVTPTPSKYGDNLQRIVDAGKTIGTDATTGQETSIYTVGTELRRIGSDLGEFLATLHPGQPLR